MHRKQNEIAVLKTHISFSVEKSNNESELKVKRKNVAKWNEIHDSGLEE